VVTPGLAGEFETTDDDVTLTADWMYVNKLFDCEGSDVSGDELDTVEFDVCAAAGLGDVIVVGYIVVVIPTRVVVEPGSLVINRDVIAVDSIVVGNTDGFIVPVELVPNIIPSDVIIDVLAVE